MRVTRFFFFLLIASISTSCFEDRDDVLESASTLEINNFIWRGLNTFYLYKEDVPELADNYFASQSELNQFLKDQSSNELFYSLLSPQDRFSFLVPNYRALEEALDGMTKHNGMEAGLVRYPDNPTQVFGYVRYVLPNTSAEAQGMQRGMIFNSVDGTQLTESNYSDLLSPETYSIGLATFENGNITPTGQSIQLEKNQYIENPIFKTKVIEVENKKIGYVMYNRFTANFDSELNAAFANLQAEGITELVLDLRYNGGGSVESSKDLASMITGQFQGEIFSTEQWNDQMQAVWEQEDPERLVNIFDNEIRTNAQINSLFLDRVYVLTTTSTASASELLINGLNPYIDVIQIGNTTTGKFQASITLYDSQNFSRLHANPGHTYALQPLVFKSLNAHGVTDYINGLQPDVTVYEDYSNLGVLGDPQETLLAAAIDHILGNAPAGRGVLPLEEVGETGMKNPLFQKMYIEPVDISIQ